MTPTSALLWFGLSVLIAAVLAWPGHGLVARWNRIRVHSDRVETEDALKHAVTTELGGRTCSADSLAGVLGISRARAHELIGKLVARGFVRSDPAGIGLTDIGREYALRMLRTHRLLERYFADRTGVAPRDWHDLAESREHVLSPAETEALAARMGDPLYDPHGDPIPTRGGRLPPTQGLPLSGLAPGETATVVHVEDEPAAVYDRLQTLGINPSVPIKLLRATPTELELLVGGTPRTVDRWLAEGVEVERVAEADSHTVLYERLDALRPGEQATVVHVSPAVQGPERRRLLDLGVLPGTLIEAEMRSPSGDPVAYRIRGALIALRKRQAEGIYIRRTEPASQIELAGGTG